MMKPALSILLVVLVAVVAGISAQPVPPKCCFPDQFEILADQLFAIVENDQVVPIAQSMQMAFDYTNKQMGQIATTYAQSLVYTHRVIINYTKGVKYIVDEKTSTCEKVALNSTNMTHCITDGIFLQTYFLGNNQTTANSFSYQITEGPTTGGGTFAVTKTDCIPLSSSFVGKTTGTQVMLGMEYKNYSSVIKDPSSYFTVPTYCPQTVTKNPKSYLNHMHPLFL